MKVEVRYYSRSGNTKALAEAIAKGAGVEAVSVIDDNAKLPEKADILFIGGALYAYGLDNNLKKYLNDIDANYVSSAVVFSTSWISKHSLDLIRKALEQKGIKVLDDVIYYKNMPKDNELKEAEEITKKIINK